MPSIIEDASTKPILTPKTGASTSPAKGINSGGEIIAISPRPATMRRNSIIATSRCNATATAQSEAPSPGAWECRKAETIISPMVGAAAKATRTGCRNSASTASGWRNARSACSATTTTQSSAVKASSASPNTAGTPSA